MSLPQDAFVRATGSLSAFLDNAPTYLTFLAAAMGDHRFSIKPQEGRCELHSAKQRISRGYLLGAVFFGAGTYIGNGPNFMIKKIAQQIGLRTPTFFGYVFRYALPVLLPVRAGVSLLSFFPWRIF